MQRGIFDLSSICTTFAGSPCLKKRALPFPEEIPSVVADDDGQLPECATDLPFRLCLARIYAETACEKIDEQIGRLLDGSSELYSAVSYNFHNKRLQMAVLLCLNRIVDFYYSEEEEETKRRSRPRLNHFKTTRYVIGVLAQQDDTKQVCFHACVTGLLEALKNAWRHSIGADNLHRCYIGAALCDLEDPLNSTLKFLIAAHTPQPHFWYDELWPEASDVKSGLVWNAAEYVLGPKEDHDDLERGEYEQMCAQYARKLLKRFGAEALRLLGSTDLGDKKPY
jgi:hypothetical protein